MRENWTLLQHLIFEVRFNLKHSVSISPFAINTPTLHFRGKNLWLLWNNNKNYQSNFCYTLPLVLPLLFLLSSLSLAFTSNNFPPLSSLSFYSSVLSRSVFRAAEQHKIFTLLILICNIFPPNFQFIRYYVLATRVKYKCRSVFRVSSEGYLDLF